MMTVRRMRFTTACPGPDGVYSILGAGEPAPDWAPAEAVEGSDPAPSGPADDPQTGDTPEATENADDAVSGHDPDGELEEDLIGGESQPDGPERPSNNGSLVDWQNYARAQGAEEADIDGRSRNELRATYGG